MRTEAKALSQKIEAEPVIETEQPEIKKKGEETKTKTKECAICGKTEDESELTKLGTKLYCPEHLEEEKEKKEKKKQSKTPKAETPPIITSDPKVEEKIKELSKDLDQIAKKVEDYSNVKQQLKEISEKSETQISELSGRLDAEKERNEKLLLELEEKKKIEELLVNISDKIVGLLEGISFDDVDLNALYQQLYSQTNDKMFQLDKAKIRNYILTNYPPVHPNTWSKLPNNDKVKFSKYPDVQVTINREHSGRESYLDDYVWLINQDPLNCIEDKYVPQKVDAKTLETIKILLKKKIDELKKSINNSIQQ